MKTPTYKQFFSALLLAAAAPLSFSESNTEGTIAFGSCLRQWQAQPVWQTIADLSPKAFIFLGDNMYSDKGPYEDQPEPFRIRQAYADLANSDDFAAFRRASETGGIAWLATWDDHDYGINDGGGDYRHQLDSKKYFMDFFGLQETASGDADKPGIYQSRFIEIAGLQTQVILLDTRSFRSPLKKSTNKKNCSPTGIIPNTNADATILGEDQWRWLGQQLEQDADLRIIASSIQIIATEHCFEKWANYPGERQRLFDLIKEKNAEHLILLSGDRHIGEISVLPAFEVGYPLYEVTASGLNSAMGRLIPVEKNQFRIDNMNVRKDNFGSLRVERNQQNTFLKLQLQDTRGKIRQSTTIELGSLEASREK